MEFWKEGRKHLDLIIGETIPPEAFRTIRGVRVATPEVLVVTKLGLIKDGKVEPWDYKDVVRLLAREDPNIQQLREFGRELSFSAHRDLPPENQNGSGKPG